MIHELNHRAMGVRTVAAGSYMMTRLATAEAVYERLTPTSKSVALKLRVYSEPERVVGMLICGMSVTANGSRRSLDGPSSCELLRLAAKQAREPFPPSIARAAASAMPSSPSARGAAHPRFMSISDGT